METMQINRSPGILEYTDISMSTYPTPSPSSESSHSPNYMMLSNLPDMQAALLEDFSSMNCNNAVPASGLFGDCHLQVLEQPIEKFRFRYKSEMSGTHGSLQGSSTEKNRKSTYPTVQLKNYHGPAVVRCALFTYSKEVPESCRQPHPHRLVMKNDAEERVDPHDKRIDPHTNPNMIVIFKGMGIIHTAKKHINGELKKKKTTLKLEEIRRTELRELTIREEIDIKNQVLDERKSINLNVVCLKFDAFREDASGVLHHICEPIYSTPIFNLKSAMTGDLKIVRMDHASSPASGGKEIFLLVEKVARKNIKVQIFEVDDDNDRKWSAEAKFHETDVHHQYAIVVKTPPYRDVNIEKEINVFISLFRPSDGEYSEARPFTYVPDRSGKRKRTRYGSEFSSSGMSGSTEMTLPPMVVDINNKTLVSDDLFKFAPQVNSDDFKRLFPEMIGDIVQNFSCVPLSGSLQFDAVGKGDSSGVERDLAKLKKEFHQIQAYLRTGHPGVEKMIRRKLNDKNEEGNNLLHLCYIYHTDEFAKKLRPSILSFINRFKLYDLLKAQNYDNESVLHLAIRNGAELDHLSELPLQHMKIEARCASPLHLAIAQNYGVDEICTHFKDQNALGYVSESANCLTPLQYAVEQKNLPLIEILVRHGAPVNCQDNRTGNNILQTAILTHREEIVEYLVKSTAVNKKHANYEGKTADMFVTECFKGMKRFNLLKMLDPERVKNNFELFESALVKEEQDSSSESDDPDMEMEIEIKAEEMPLNEDTPNLGEFIKEMSKIAIEKDIISRLYEDLNFGYMLETDAMEERNPMEFLIHLALSNNVRVSEIREALVHHGIIEGINCIDRLINR